MATPIAQYRLYCNTKANVGKIEILLQDQADWIDLPIKTPEEYISTVLILSKQPVLYDTESGIIHLPARPVGT